MFKPLAIAVAIACFSSYAAAHKPAHGDHAILKQLDLSAEQKQDIRQIIKQARADRNLFRQDVIELKDELKHLITDTEWDENAVRSALAQRQPLRSAAAMDRAQRKHQVWLLLDEQQQQKFITLSADRQPPEMRELSQRWLSRLDLTDAQQADIDSILSAHQNNLEQHRAQRQALRKAETALIASDAFSETTLQALYAQYQDKMLDAQVKHAYTRHQVWQVLNDEQRQQLTHMMERKKHHHKRHGA